MKCDKCGYDDKGTGDTAHLCGPINVMPAMSKDTSRSAFPNQVLVTDEKFADLRGMTLRQYYVAHAPEEPQPWFKPVMPPKPDATIWVGDSGNKYTSYFAAKQAEGEEYVTLFNARELEAWEVEYVKQKYVQWPFAWADAMIAEGSK